MEQYYKSSGKYSPLSFALWIGVALIALPILALIYAYSIWYIPIPYINFFITGIFGFLIGIVVSKLVLKVGKVRNGKLAFVFCLFAALTALYIHWVVWIDLAFNVTGTVGSDTIGIAKSNINIGEVISLLLQPKAVFSIMGEINEVGVWGIKGGTVKGGFLTFIWVIEILLTTVVALITAVGQSSKPFCEVENSWFEENKVGPLSHFEDGGSLVKALSIGDMDALGTMLKPATDPKKNHHSTVTLYDAKSGENFVTITNQIGKLNDKNELKFETVPVTSFLKISQAVADTLKQVR